MALTSNAELAVSGMPSDAQRDLDLGLEPLPQPKPVLTISPSSAKLLSPAQLEFNKRMKALEKARAAHDRERARLDDDLRICHAELMPMVEKINRTERELVFTAVEVRRAVKLTPKRHKWLGDLISGKAADLLADPVGLNDEEIERLEVLIEEVGPSLLDQERKEMEREEFNMMRRMMEEMARMAGVKLDLDGLDLDGDPEEFLHQLEERITAAGEEFQKVVSDKTPPPKRTRKPSKAALERERLRQETEEAKTRDFKSLYKQLAKVLHPDLETDPVLKAHKQVWMQRLTAARANGDLRDMLAIEMEWLGEEAGNLAKASDEKLRVYAMVLKEQLQELREQTHMLAHEPQYHALLRFADPFGMRRNLSIVKSGLAAELARLEEMVGCLRAGGSDARTMVCQWADAHSRACKR